MRYAMSLAMVPPEHLVELAQVAEEAGFDTVSLPDSVFYPEKVSGDYPYTSDGKRMWLPETPMADPIVAAAALAATTRRIRLQTTVLKLPLRDPLLLAKQVATIAALAEDRFTLGVGLSWMPEEFRFTGTEMGTRGARTDEAIAILRRICGGGGPAWAEFHGDHYDFDRLMIAPAPMSRVPILVGGHSEAALRRAAMLADGWISANKTLDELAPVIRRVKDHRAASARSGEPFTICISPVGVSEPEDFRKVEQAGVDEVYLAPWRFYGHGIGDRQQRIDSVRRFAAEIIDRA